MLQNFVILSIPQICSKKLKSKQKKNAFMKKNLFHCDCRTIDWMWNGYVKSCRGKWISTHTLNKFFRPLKLIFYLCKTTVWSNTLNWKVKIKKKTLKHLKNQRFWVWIKLFREMNVQPSSKQVFQTIEANFLSLQTQSMDK